MLPRSWTRLLPKLHSYASCLPPVRSSRVMRSFRTMPKRPRLHFRRGPNKANLFFQHRPKPLFPDTVQTGSAGQLDPGCRSAKVERNKIQEVNSLLNKKADLLEKTGNYAAALQTSLRQLGILDSLPMETVDGNEKWELFYRIARMHFYTGDYESCLLFLYQVLEGCKDTDLNIRAHAFLSKTFINLHQFPLATKHIRSAEALIDSLPRGIDTSTLFTYSNQKAALYPKSVIRLWGDCPLVSCNMLLA